MSWKNALLCFIACGAIAVAQAPHAYQAQIRRTTYGIPHIVAKDYGSLGFGEGYALAEDHLCSLADQVIKARGERSKYFGAGERDANLNNDVTMKAYDMVKRGAVTLTKQPAELRAWYDGYVAGYNQYLKEKGRDHVGGWCQGADWVMPITVSDLMAYQEVVLMVTTSFAQQIATAQPPAASTGGTASLKAFKMKAVDWTPPDFASNGWGIGKDISASGQGMLLANPHYPWAGSNRFWEKHLTIPGQLDVYGAGLIGSPGVAIGFNKDVAWTHTVSAGKRFTFYQLDLAPGKPTTYRIDGKDTAMTAQHVTVQVKQADGTLKSMERDVWFSQFGPVINFSGVGWTDKHVLAVRDTNAGNTTSAAQWLAMGRAHSMKEFQEAHAKYQGMPWVNTISSSREGIAWYIDDASTPDLSKDAIAAWRERTKSDELTKKIWAANIVLLDGSTSRFNWQSAGGLVDYAHQPKLERTDFVFNSNDSFWLANPRQLLDGDFSPMHGEQNTARTLRTRNNALTLSTFKKVSLDDLGDAILRNNSLAADLLRAPLVARCKTAATELQAACKVLDAWDGRFDLDSRGAVLFREWLGQFAQPDFLAKGPLFAVDFDAKDPLNTPRGLSESSAPIDNLAKAVKVLTARSIALDVPLGELQYADKHGRHIPIHGGDGFIDGLMNMQHAARNGTTLEPEDNPKLAAGSRFLTEKGYPVGHGSSFLMALEFTAQGPHAKAFLTYGESGQYDSPHYTDQSELYSKKQWRAVLFDEKSIAANVERAYTVKN